MEKELFFNQIFIGPLHFKIHVNILKIVIVTKGPEESQRNGMTLQIMLEVEVLNCWGNWLCWTISLFIL